MAYTARKVEYFYTTLNAKAADAYALLDNLAALGVNLLALNSLPMGPETIQLTLFPEDASHLQRIAKQAGLTLTGPHSALLVQGDDEIGVMARIYERMRREHVDVFASNVVTDGKGRYGCILYLRPSEADRAAHALSE
jgi:hypothetical protein